MSLLALCRTLGLAILFGCTAGNALAWNSAGHRLSAAIAWQHLDEKTRSSVTELLRQHPDWHHWIARSHNDDPDLLAEDAFIEASTWADEWRRLTPREPETRSAAPTPPGLAIDDGHAHADWHYLNRPIDTRGHLGRGSTGGSLDTALDDLSALLATPDQLDSRRARALVWLIHLCGDAHQPLHTVTHLQTDGSDDGGGNGLLIHDPENPRLDQQSLHAWWDDRPGPPWLRGQKLAVEAQRLDADSPTVPHRSPQEWIRESQQLARREAYRNLNGTPPITLSPEYRDTAQRLAEHQIATAGRRLAYWLITLLNTY